VNALQKLVAPEGGALLRELKMRGVRPGRYVLEKSQKHGEGRGKRRDERESRDQKVRREGGKRYFIGQRNFEN